MSSYRKGWSFQTNEFRLSSKSCPYILNDVDRNRFSKSSKVRSGIVRSGSENIFKDGEQTNLMKQQNDGSVITRQ